MPTPTKGKRLGGSAAHQKAILSNLATSLFEHGAITTTEAKARRLRPFAEKLISKAKRGDLHNRRQVLSVVRDKGVVHTLFTEIGPRYATRPGGYTRITKLGPRKGDNAPMAVIALVEEEFTPQVRSTRSTSGGSTAVSATPVVADVADPTDVDDASTGATAVDEALGVEDEPTVVDAGADVVVPDADDVTVTVSGDTTVTVTDGEPSEDEAPADAVADVPGDVDPAPESRDNA